MALEYGELLDTQYPLLEELRDGIASVMQDLNDLEALRAIAQNEINYQISYFFDEGFTVKLGDSLNGFKATSPLCDDFEEVTEWLVEQVKLHYPDSDFVSAKKGEG